MEHSNELQTRYLRATLHSRTEVLARSCPVPSVPGFYGWWFRNFPKQLDLSGCVQRCDATLLYAGISPKQPPTNGRSPSGQNLRKRIVNHYRGNAEGSTLRLTLGVLLRDELGIQLRRVGSGTRRTFGRAGEAALSSWMSDNAMVSWVVHPEPWIAERNLFKSLNLPLNLRDNQHNGFHAELTLLRAEAARIARELPVLDELSAMPGDRGS